MCPRWNQHDRPRAVRPRFGSYTLKTQYVTETPYGCTPRCGVLCVEKSEDYEPCCRKPPQEIFGKIRL